MTPNLISRAVLQSPGVDAKPGAPPHTHCVPLADGWTMWRLFCLRAAGFPAQNVLRLRSTEELRGAVNKLLFLEEMAHRHQANAVAGVRSALDALRADGRWDDQDERAALLKSLSRLKAGTISGVSTQALTLDTVGAFAEALKHLAEARRVVRDQYAISVTRDSQVLAEFAGSPRFREAILWQNRQAVHTALDRLRDVAEAAGQRRKSHQKQHEELVASYLQRYSVKNDTIGFLGPVGWGDLVDEGDVLLARPGPDLLAKRTVYFEVWPIEAVCASILQEPAIYPWLAPFRVPFLHVDGPRIVHSLYGPLRLTEEESAVVHACNGEAIAKDIAARLVNEGRGFRDEAHVYNAIKTMATKGILFWGLNVPLGPYPEVYLRRALEKIGAPELRRRMLAPLEHLESARSLVAEAAGDDKKLDTALSSLERTFTQLTRMKPTRRPGEMYSARTLVYEDCRRDLDLALGPQFLERLAPPLSLLLASARWLTARFAEMYRERLSKLHAEMTRATGKRAVDAAQFIMRATPYIFAENDKHRSALQDNLQNKWLQVLELDDIRCQAQALRYSTEELRAKTAIEFACERAGWNGARYHSPDVMIAAADEHAIRRGDYLLVLGELHVGGNTLSASLFFNQHPSPQHLVRSAELDLAGPNVIPVIAKEMSKLTGRLSPELNSPNDYFLEYGRNSFATDRSRALPIGSLLIEERNGDLVVRRRDGTLQFNITELLGMHLSGVVLGSFHLLPPRKHFPRISIDDLVIKRESWSFRPEEIPFVECREANERFVQAQKWARLHRLPRFLFFKAPSETKPCYLDLESPIYVELFAKIVRRTVRSGAPDSAIHLSEMLPGPDQIWLSDNNGNRYTSELRMVAVDQNWCGTESQTGT